LSDLHSTNCRVFGSLFSDYVAARQFFYGMQSEGHMGAVANGFVSLPL